MLLDYMSKWQFLSSYLFWLLLETGFDAASMFHSVMSICLVVFSQYGMEGCVQFLRSGSVKCWKKGCGLSPGEGTLLLE